MILKGIPNFSLGNFLSLRGFASMGDLYSHSVHDPSIQRGLPKLPDKEKVAFLREGKYRSC